MFQITIKILQIFVVSVVLASLIVFIPFLLTLIMINLLILFLLIYRVLHHFPHHLVTSIILLVWMLIPYLLGFICSNKKSNNLETFKLFKTMVLNQFNSFIKVVQSYWGGEFRPFTKFLSDHRIQHRLIYPLYSPLKWCSRAQAQTYCWTGSHIVFSS